MKQDPRWLILAVTAWASAGPAGAQAPPAAKAVPAIELRGPQPPSPETAARTAAETAAAAEDVAILKALTEIGLSRAQLSELLPVLRGAQVKLAELEASLAAKLAAQRAALEEARRDLLTGKGSGSRAEEQYNLAQAAAAQQRAGLRADLVVSLRRLLSKTLSPDQLTQMAQTGQVAIITQRVAGWGRGDGWRERGRGNDARGSFRAAQPDRGRGRNGEEPGALGAGGGRGGRMFGGLDRVRGMSQSEFQEFVQQRAERFGGQNSSQYQQYLALMNQVRSMPDSQYALQRDRLMAQSMLQARGWGPRSFIAGTGGMAGNDEEAVGAFVERYLLSPRAPVVVAERIQAR